MKTLITFFNTKPSYFKVNNTMVSAKTGIKESTVAKFKKTSEYRLMRAIYLNSLKK
jgi:hypothetical protein